LGFFSPVILQGAFVPIISEMCILFEFVVGFETPRHFQLHGEVLLVGFLDEIPLKVPAIGVAFFPFLTQFPMSISLILPRTVMARIR